MEKENKHIKEYHENLISQLLIESHTIGGIRDQSDFDNIRFHCKQSLNFAKDIIENIDGTDKEKSDFIHKVWEDLDKFTVNDKK